MIFHHCAGAQQARKYKYYVCCGLGVPMQMQTHTEPICSCDCVVHGFGVSSSCKILQATAKPRSRHRKPGGGQSLSVHHIAVWLIWLSKERTDLDCLIAVRLRGRAVQIHKCVGRFFLSEPRRLGMSGRARPSGTERKSQNRPAMVRFSGAPFSLYGRVCV